MQNTKLHQSENHFVSKSAIDSIVSQIAAQFQPKR